MDISLKSTHMSTFHSDILRNARFDSQTETGKFSNVDVPKTPIKKNLCTSATAAKDDSGDKIEIITKKGNLKLMYSCDLWPKSSKLLTKHTSVQSVPQVMILPKV